MKAKSILRWLLVLPTAIVGVMVSQLLAHLLAYLWNTISIFGIEIEIASETASSWLWDLLSAILFPIGFIVGGMWMAPKFRTVVATVLAFILIVLVAAGTPFVMLSANYTRSKTWFLATSIISCAVALYVAVISYQFEKVDK